MFIALIFHFNNIKYFIRFVFAFSDLNKSGQSETDPFLENDKADGAPASENAVTENATEP